MDYYKLDPCHYFTSPRPSWDAMLKIVGAELQLTSTNLKKAFVEVSAI